MGEGQSEGERHSCQLNRKKRQGRRTRVFRALEFRTRKGSCRHQGKEGCHQEIGQGNVRTNELYYQSQHRNTDGRWSPRGEICCCCPASQLTWWSLQLPIRIFRQRDIELLHGQRQWVHVIVSPRGRGCCGAC